jgi:hypothetical protein
MTQAAKVSRNVSYCFADRFVSRDEVERQTEQEDVAQFLKAAAGLTVTTWLPKPGKARHMGVARL